MVYGHQRSESFRRLLREISQAGAIPRIDLAARTGISRATITTITGELLRGGLIEEVQRASDTDTPRGRPRVDLKIAGTHPYSVGIKVSTASISFVLVDFEGTEIAGLDQPMTAGPRALDDLTDEIEKGLQALAKGARIDDSKIRGVGVGIDGLVQAETGTVYWSPSLQARNVRLRDHLSHALDLPVFVDNEANLVAVAEHLFGLGKSHSDFIVVTIESGVGMGIVLGGELYRGTRGCGGEFGHTKVQMGGALCRCEQRGCVEAYVADYALQREAVTKGLVAATMETEDAVAHVIKAASAGDPVAADILEQARRVFAVGLANLVNIFDPELIILAGAQTQFDHLYADALIEEMAKSLVDVDRPAPEVVVHKWGNRMWALGAAAYALEYVRDAAVRDLVEA